MEAVLEWLSLVGIIMLIMLEFILIKIINTVEPVYYSGHPGNHQKWLLKRGDLLAQVKIHAIDSNLDFATWLL